MDPSEPPKGRPSPRQELQGPRPIHLKARKEPNKTIKRSTPAAPLPPRPPPPPPPPPPHRPPVIIYTESPKVIHTTPRDFMSLVQRLTGATSSSSTANAAAASSHSTSDVRTVGETASAIDEEGPKKNGEGVFDQVEIDGGEPNFFPPSIDPNSLNILYDEPTPAFDSNKNFVENTSSLESPSNFLTTPAEPSTGGYWDPFNHYQDFDQFDP